MTGGTPQGTPLSPSLFMIYMSAMVKRREEIDEKLQRESNERHNLRSNGRPPLTRSLKSLQFINDCNSIVHGNVKDMDKALGQAAEEFKLKWDRRKPWKNKIHLRVNLDRKRHQKFTEGKANAGFQLVRHSWKGKTRRKVRQRRRREPG